MKKSKFVIVKVSPESVGGFTFFKDWDKSEKKGHEYCESANGMALALWTRERYEEWHNGSVASYYA